MRPARPRPGLRLSRACRKRLPGWQARGSFSATLARTAPRAQTFDEHCGSRGIWVPARSVCVVGSEEQSGTSGVAGGEAPTPLRNGQENDPGSPAHASSAGAGPSEFPCSRSCTRDARGGKRQGCLARVPGPSGTLRRQAGHSRTRAFVCTPVRSPPPGAWCLAHLPGVGSLSGAGCGQQRLRFLSDLRLPLGSGSLKQSTGWP